MSATSTALAPPSSEPLPNSRRVYLPGSIHPDLRVPLREILLTPAPSDRGGAPSNEPVRVYDCAGPWGDPAFEGDVEQGLPPLRRPWILERGDVRAGAERRAPDLAPVGRVSASPALGTARAVAGAPRQGRHSTGLCPPRPDYSGNGVYRDPREPGARGSQKPGPRPASAGTWAANPSGPPFPRRSRLNSSAPKWRGAGRSFPPISIIRSPSRWSSAAISS